jgi:3-oxoacyl-[acyl-carrier protein] reductase
MLLSDRVAIITGGARGIGRGIALKFAEQGCTLVIADLLEAQAKKVVEEVSKKGRDAFFLRCDVADSQQVEDLIDQAIDRFEKIDILVNNAGVGAVPKSITELSEEEWDSVLAINLKGIFLCCREIVPHMKKRGYGRIINISSMAAIAPPAPSINYTASKSGVLGLTLDLALELAQFGICVNVILPGAIRSEMWDPLIPPGVNPDDFFEEVGKTIAPMQRVGSPDDIAGVALFLASDLARYVTGDRILVGGGAPLLKRV